jgi:hypothetical protein
MGKAKDIVNIGTRFFIAYFCVITVTIQTAINNVALLCPNYYPPNVAALCNNLFGASFLTAALMVSICNRFHLCRWSWACAVCEVIFVVTNLLIPDSHTYNLLIQIVSGTVSVLLSIYIKYTAWKRQKSLS